MGAFFDLQVIMNIIEGAVEGPGDTIQDAIEKSWVNLSVSIYRAKGFVRVTHRRSQMSIACKQDCLL